MKNALAEYDTRPRVIRKRDIETESNQFRENMEYLSEELDEFAATLLAEEQHIRDTFFLEKQMEYDANVSWLDAAETPYEYWDRLMKEWGTFGDGENRFGKFLESDKNRIIREKKKGDELKYLDREEYYRQIEDRNQQDWEQAYDGMWYDEHVLIETYEKRRAEQMRLEKLEAEQAAQRAVEEAELEAKRVQLEEEMFERKLRAKDLAASELESTPPMENSDNANVEDHLNAEDDLEIPITSGGEAEIDEGVGLSDLINIFSEDWWSDDSLTGTGKMGMMAIAIYTTLMAALMLFIGCGRQAASSQMNANYYDGYYDDDYYYDGHRRMLDTPFTRLAEQIGVDLEKESFVHDSGASEVSPEDLLDIQVPQAIVMAVCVVALYKIYNALFKGEQH